eukprot:3043707-Karenia_brevis.AAC.2
MLSFNSAISACQKGRQWQHMAQLLNEMQQCALMLSLNSAISACVKGGIASIGRSCSITCDRVLDAQTQRGHSACEQGSSCSMRRLCLMRCNRVTNAQLRRSHLSV